MFIAQEQTGEFSVGSICQTILLQVFWPAVSLVFWQEPFVRGGCPSHSLTLSGLGYFGQKTSFSNAGHKTVKNHENKKNNGTFTLTTLKVDGVKVVLFFLFSNV